MYDYSSFCHNTYQLINVNNDNNIYIYIYPLMAHSVSH